jgi:hypothetical protein
MKLEDVSLEFENGIEVLIINMTITIPEEGKLPTLMGLQHVAL